MQCLAAQTIVCWGFVNEVEKQRIHGIITVGKRPFLTKARLGVGWGTTSRRNPQFPVRKCHCNPPREQLVTDAMTPPHIF